MKKFLLSLAAAALCSSAMATTVTFDFENNAYGLPNDQATYVTVPAEITSEGVTIKLQGDENSWRYWTDGLREYNKKNPTMTFTAGENIKKITWKVKSGVNFSETSAGAAISEWTGDASSVTLYLDSSTGNAAIQTLTVEYGETTGGDENPGGGNQGGNDNPGTGDEGEGGSVTFDFSKSTYGAGPAYTDNNTPYVTTDNVATSNGVKVTFTPNADGDNAWRFWSDGIRAYKNKNAVFTVSVPDGKVTGVSWTVKSGATFALEGTAENITSWEGDEDEVSFVYTNTSSNLALITLTVTYTGGNGEGGNQGGGDEPDQPEQPGEVITVADALSLLESGQTNISATVKGIISKIDEISTSYGNATYYIKDALTDEKALEVYRGYWMDGEKFTSADQIKVGGEVTVEGTLVNYNGTYEFTTGSKIIAYTAPSGDVEPDEPDQPGDEDEVSEDFTNGIGLPESAANVPTEATEYTSTETGITYTLYGCYTNSGYLMVNSKTYKSAYISWTLDFPMAQLIMKTTSGCSTNVNNYVNVYAGETLIERVFAGVQNETLTINIPEACQDAGTVYKVEADAAATANLQFASFTYVEAENSTLGVSDVVATDGEAVYFNLQGVRINNPERGIFVKVQNGKATKVVK